MFQLAISVGNGHTVTVTGSTVEEFKTAVVWLGENAHQLIEATVPFNVTVTDSGPAPTTHPGPTVAAPAGPAPGCTHGTMRLVQGGISKAGKPYGAFYGCTSQDRESQCQSVYV